MAELIVDFPPLERLDSQSNKRMLSATRTRQRSVRFAETSTLTIIDPVIKEELKLRWYSKRERDLLREHFAWQVNEAQEKLATSPMAMIGQEDLIECVGMERFLSREVYLHTEKRRRIHVRAILVAQERLRVLNISDGEQLSRLSEQSSEWTVTRSHNIAVKYWEILKPE